MTLSQKNLRIIKRVTWIGFRVNAALMGCKLFFGYYGHSDALVADGFHSMSDFATDFVVLVLVGIAYKKADHDHPYGHGKFETVASIVIAVILLAVAFGIAFSGVGKIVDFFNGGTLPRPDVWTLVVAFISIVAKEWLYRFTYGYGKRVGSEALVANAWHHRSDALSSLAALFGVGLSYFLGDRWLLADPVTSIVIGVLVGVSAVRISLPALKELMEISLPADEVHRIEKAIRSTPGVVYYHNLRTRRNGHSSIVDVNIHVCPDLTVGQGHRVASHVEQAVHKVVGPDLIIYVHVEPAGSCSSAEKEQ